VTVPPPPSATYRLQFHAGFTFEDARKLTPYLYDLGISHIYASPYLRARSGSMHGYDVADPSSLNPELGTTEDFDRMVSELRQRGMGQLVDIVPNHMGIGDPGNYRWRDVLENGPASIYARFFDINWRPTLAQPQDQLKLVVPQLGDQYGKVLENGELSVEYTGGAFNIAYYDHRFPVAPDTYPLILDGVLSRLEDELGRRAERVQELASIVTAIRHLPPRRMLDADAMEERNREKEIVKRRLERLHAEFPEFRAVLADELRAVNGSREEGASSFDRLDGLIDHQSYRLAFWRVAAEEINYRRFFDITELAAVRMEDPAVFADTHRLLLRLVGEGKIQGLRIDHPDGLRDPAAYFRRLQDSCLSALQPNAPSERFYVVVEKILASDEALRRDWPVHGTTGYDFLNVLNGVFVGRNNEQFFSTIYFRFLRQGAQRFRDLANSTKKMVMLISLASEVNELGYMLRDIAGGDRRHRDFTLNSLTFVIREVIAALGIYRTFIDPETGVASEADRIAIEQAVAEAKRRNPRTDPSIFDFVGDTLLLRDESSAVSLEQRLNFIARFQQTTGPVMAKGTEDTAFYQYNRLVSLNEVGGDPDSFGRSLTAFHRHNQERARDWPATLLASSTHDTKRSEDVRARINVLSELPREWRSALTRWTRLNGRKKPSLQGRVAPDRNEEYLLYQTILGAWPIQGLDDEFARRVCEFMLKALKEAKVHTSWITPNTEYEEAVLHFTRTILDPAESHAFLDDLEQLQRKVAWFGMFNSLSQTVLKLGAPGAADVYQGNELWDFSLVDPDNRRPVDFRLRQKLLASVLKDASRDRPGLARELVASAQDGRVKMYVSQRLLCLRREQPGLFVGSSYTALRGNPHVAAFARAAEGKTLLIAAPVQIATLMRGNLAPPAGADVWHDERLPVPGSSGTTYEDLFTGRRLTTQEGATGAALRLADVFSDFPVAALLSVS
jgi:(1->4)-alpha-D-glucan 1-alpha-D-glucosylmutase